ncbi:MAG TPA: inositol monophosphatase family protein [Acidimicrobiales bacterium]|nr:inositol monophosphatase family protein [Acidimicrobiales bacterium]
MDTGTLVDRVAAILREVAAEVVEPRFANLADGDVDEKAPNELVTTADTEAEALLVRQLGDLLPGVPVVGEEATAAHGQVPFDLIGEAPRVWLVDPLDGTSNFVAGAADWGVMAALVEQGRTVLAWIWRPIDRRLYVAERGGGAWADGRRLERGDPPAETDRLRGGVLRRFLDDSVRATVDRNAGRFAGVTTGRMAAAVEYPLIAEGHQDFAVFGRTLPWDHAPGALLVEEAGGVAWRHDGTPYRPDQSTSGLLVAAGEAAWATVRAELLDLEPYSPR